MGFTDYMRNALLDEVWGGTNFVPPASLFIGLSTTAPNDSGGNITEPVGNAYARVEVVNDTTNWPAAAAGAKSNGTAITFPEATGSWGTVTHFFISDASSGGNIIGWGALTVSKTIGAGDTAKFDVNDLDIQLT